MKTHALRNELLIGLACLFLLAITTSVTAYSPLNQKQNIYLAPNNLLMPEGDFEADPAQVWVEQDTTNCTPWIVDDDLIVGLPKAFSGGRYLWAGGFCGTPNSNFAEQTIAIDENKTMISFWYYAIRGSADSFTTDDFAYIEVNNERIWELPMTLANNTDEWVNVTLDLSAYLNETIVFRAGAENGSRSGYGNVFYDYFEYIEDGVETPEIEIVKNPATQTIQVGGTAEFQITVQNTGNVTLFDIVVDDPLASASCGFEVEQLSINESVTHNCEIAGVQDSFTNSASVTANDGFGTAVNDSATAEVVVINPAIEIIISPETQTILNGETATFSIKVTNTGTENLTNTQISSDLVGDCDEAIGQLLAGASHVTSCEATNVTQSFLNSVAVTAKYGGETISDTDSAFVDVEDTEISIFIEAQNTAVLKGERAQFSVFLFNVGDVDLTNIQVVDALAPDCNRTIELLEAGDSKSYTCESEPVTSVLTNEIVATLAGGGVDADVIQIDMLDTNLTATAVNTMLPATGGEVEMSISIRNDSSKPLELTDVATLLMNNQTTPAPLAIKNSSCQTPTLLAIGATYNCSFVVDVPGNAGLHQIEVLVESLDDGETAVTDIDAVSITVPIPEIKTIFLPMVANEYVYSEPNDTCGSAFPIGVNHTYHFLADDVNDWYIFSTTEAGHLIIELTDFAPVNGQIILYAGNCIDATFLQNNGDFSTTKMVDLGHRPAGDYLIWLIADGPTSPAQTYNLIVKRQ